MPQDSRRIRLPVKESKHQRRLILNAFMRQRHYEPVPNQLMQCAVDQVTEDILELDLRHPMQQLARHEHLLQALKNALSQKYPSLLSSSIGEQLLADEAVQQKIEDSTVLSVLKNPQNVTLGKLEDPELYEKVVNYLSRKHPDWDLSGSIAHRLLEGDWAQDIQQAIEETTEEKRTTLRNEGSDAEEDCPNEG